MKTSILTTLIALAGSATLMAQTNVYSLNAVGYVNTVIPTGFSIIANPLNAATNSLNDLIPNAPVNSAVYRYNGSYQTAVYGPNDDNVNVWEPNFVVTPGEGFWIKNAGAAFTNTFVGEVPQGSLTNPIPQNFSIKSSQVPQSAILTDSVTPANGLLFPAEVNDIVYFYRNGAYVTCVYGPNDDNINVWEPPAIPAVGEGFWVKTSNSKNWTRSFTTSQ